MTRAMHAGRRACRGPHRQGCRNGTQPTSPVRELTIRCDSIGIPASRTSRLARGGWAYPYRSCNSSVLIDPYSNRWSITVRGRLAVTLSASALIRGSTSGRSSGVCVEAKDEAGHACCKHASLKVLTHPEYAIVKSALAGQTALSRSDY